jgi:hypothetical protein
MSIVETTPPSLVAYVGEEYADQVPVGTEVTLRRRQTGAPLIRSRVQAVGPALVQIPVRAAPEILGPRWGVPVYIVLPAGDRVRPGEAFDVQITPAGE